MRREFSFVLVFLMLISAVPLTMSGEVIHGKYETVKLFPTHPSSLERTSTTSDLPIVISSAMWYEEITGTGLYGTYDRNHTEKIHLNLRNEGSMDAVIEIKMEIDQDGDGTTDMTCDFGRATVTYRFGGETVTVDRNAESVTGTWRDMSNGTVKLMLKKTESSMPDIFIDPGSLTYVVLPYNQMTPYAMMDVPETIRQFTMETFDGSYSIDPNGDDLNHFWDLDVSDGLQADVMGPVVKRYFNVSGIFTVTLTVTDGHTSDIISKEIEVKENNRPVADAGSDITVNRKEDFLLDGSNSLDIDDDPLNYTWDLGDGIARYGDRVWHNFSDSGQYDITLNVTDGFNMTSDDVIVTVSENHPPDVDFSIETSDYRFGEPITFNGSLSTDMEGDEIISYLWDFGDGNTSGGMIVNHTFLTSGLLTITLTVSDGMDEGTASIEISIPENELPTGEMDIPEYAMNGSVVELSVLEIKDPEGTNCTVEWSIDGVHKEGIAVNHTFAEPGIYSIEATVIDGFGGSRTYDGKILVLDTTVFSPSRMVIQDNVSYHHGVETCWYMVSSIRVDHFTGEVEREIHPMGGYRIYEMDLPANTRYNISVEVVKGEKIDVLLVSGEDLSNYLSMFGEYMDWYEYGTDLNTMGHSFTISGGEELYLIVGNNGKMKYGADPKGPVEFTLDVEFYKNVEPYIPPDSSDDDDDDDNSERGIEIMETMCLGLFIVLPILVIISIILGVVFQKRKREKEKAKLNEDLQKFMGDNGTGSTENPSETGAGMDVEPGVAPAPPGMNDPPPVAYSPQPETVSPDESPVDTDLEETVIMDDPPVEDLSSNPFFQDPETQEDPVMDDSTNPFFQ